MPDPPAPHRFPVFAAFAPVLASLAVWAITHSVLALAFAALGPVIAIATTADSRFQQRRTRRADAVTFTADIARTRVAISAAHDEERREAERLAPPVSHLLADLEHQPRRWTIGDGVLAVRLGVGETPSELQYDDGGPQKAERDARLDELRNVASTVVGSPIVVDARGGIGFVGPPHFVQAAARGVELQVAIFVSPARTAGAALRTASELSELPRDLAVVVEISRSGSAAVVRSPDGSQLGAIDLEYVSREASALALAELAACAEREGVRRADGTALASEVTFAELPRDGSTSTLAAAIGLGEAGSVHLDLVADGPHAIVGGTTGAGKSELLTTWVVGMARDRSPEAVTFLFVDFKGGAAFDVLRPLRHCVGVITDLDPGESLRALSSLGAELRHRERELARLGLRSIADAEGSAPFARLVVVVDEYAALVETHSVLHSVFADIASRGRSLGVHLVLCTQRPAGVVRDGILANCALRVSLRVTSAADSTAVIGTDAAAALPARPLGRALVSVASAPPELLQVARTTADDILEVVERWRESAPPRSPWLPPLEAHIAARSVDPGEPDTSLPFGLLDRPDEQRREVARWDPLAHGSLLVVGNAGSGKTGMLAALAGATTIVEVVRVAPGLPALWDALTAALEASDAPDRMVLLIDDVDAVVAACADDYQVALVDLLTRVLREGPARGIHLVLTAHRLSGALASVAALCGARVVLRTSDRQEHLLAGGESAQFIADLAPGGGHWRGHRLQGFDADPVPVVAEPASFTAVDLDSAIPLAVVSTQPDRFAALAREIAPGVLIAVLGGAALGGAALGGADVRGDAAVIVSDADGWQAHWGLLADLRREGRVLFDGCTPADIRVLTRVRELPPPFARSERTLWLLDRAGRLQRARLVAPVVE